MRRESQTTKVAIASWGRVRERCGEGEDLKEARRAFVYRDLTSESYAVQSAKGVSTFD